MERNTILAVLLLMLALNCLAKPPEETILGLLDTYELVPGSSSKASDLYAGEGMEIKSSSYFEANREEYLAIIPLVKGPKTSQMAFAAWQDADGSWQRSGWYELGFLSIDKIDLEGDGLQEIILETEYAGRKMTKSSYKILSIRNDEEVELYSVEGFVTGRERMMELKEGEQISSLFDIELKDLNGDGGLEVVEKITDKFYVFSYDNINMNQEFDEDDEPILPGVQKKTTVYRMKEGELVEMKLKEKQADELD